MRPAALLVLGVTLAVLVAGTAAADIVVEDLPAGPRPPPGPHEVGVRVAFHLGPFASSVFGEPYRVQPGDTMMKIAREVLGDAQRWREIATWNPAVEPIRMQVGAGLLMPAGSLPTESPLAFFVIPSDAAAHPLVPEAILYHGSGNTTWRVAAVPHAEWEAFMAATQAGDAFASKLEAMHAMGRVALSAPYGGRTTLPGHDRPSVVVLDVKVTAIEGGEVHTEAARRGPLPAAPGPPVLGDVVFENRDGGDGPSDVPVTASEEASAGEPPIGTATIALLTAILLSIVVAAFFALRHIEQRRSE